jgi:hypothetical protein
MVTREPISISNSPPPCLRAHSIAGRQHHIFLKVFVLDKLFCHSVVYGTNLFEFNGHLFYKPIKLLP